MKTIGIGVDNYKIKKFKKALAKAGFDEVKVLAFTNDSSLLKVFNVPDERVHDIHRICQKLQLDFNRSN